MVLEVSPQFQYGPEALKDIYVGSSTNQQVPLCTLVNSNINPAPIVINHQGMFPVDDDLVQSEAGRCAGRRGRRHPRSSKSRAASRLRVATTFQGNAQAFQSALASTPLLIAGSLVVIYIILGVLYESTIHPITILSTLPSAGIGALLLLMAVHLDLSVIAIIGIILLIGIVKKNGIMLVDFALQVEREEELDPGGVDLSRLHVALPADPDDDHGGLAWRRAADARAPATAPNCASRWATPSSAASWYRSF